MKIAYKGLVLIEIIALIIIVLIAKIYTKTLVPAFLVLILSLIIFIKYSPEKYTGLSGLVVFLILIFANLFVISLVLMEIGDLLYNNRDYINYPKRFASVIGFGYSLMYFSIFCMIGCASLLFLRRIFKK